MKGANYMRSSFYCSSLCFLGIQGLLLKSLSSLEINCCALLNACPNGNVVMLDEVGSFFFFTTEAWMNRISLLKSNKITRVW
jgi:hypothetical protein